MTAEFIDVTEIGGQGVSAEQLDRTCHRYHWASRIVAGLDTLEVACGSGSGLELLVGSARSLTAGDYSAEVLAHARANAVKDVSLSVFGAEDLPFPDASFDAVLMFEALYYVPSPDRFFAEAFRVLRNSGRLLIVTCNKDLYDFNPSPYSHEYLGVAELNQRLIKSGFRSDFSGYTDTRKVSRRQRILRPAKALAARFGLIPKTMHAKELLKKFYFGNIVAMPTSVAGVDFKYQPPIPLPTNQPDRVFKVIYCIATKF